MTYDSRLQGRWSRGVFTSDRTRELSNEGHRLGLFTKPTPQFVAAYTRSVQLDLELSDSNRDSNSTERDRTEPDAST